MPLCKGTYTSCLVLHPVKSVIHFLNNWAYIIIINFYPTTTHWLIWLIVIHPLKCKAWAVRLWVQKISIIMSQLYNILTTEVASAIRSSAAVSRLYSVDSWVGCLLLLLLFFIVYGVVNKRWCWWWWTLFTWTLVSAIRQAV